MLIHALYGFLESFQLRLDRLDLRLEFVALFLVEYLLRGVANEMKALEILAIVSVKELEATNLE